MEVLDRIQALSPVLTAKAALHLHYTMRVFCRMDYQLATPGLAALARQASVYKDSWFSDHAPLTVDYDFAI